MQNMFASEQTRDCVRATPSQAESIDILGRASGLRRHPFEHVLIEQALSPERYEPLSATFPTLDVLCRGRRDYGSNQAVRMAVRNVLGNPAIGPEWQEFFAYHTSAQFWRSLVAVFGDSIRRHHPDLEARVGKPFEAWTVKRRGESGETDIALDCLFVANTPVSRRSSVKPPHIDRSDKLFTGLFYCRDPLDTTAGGDLELHELMGAPLFDKHQIAPGRSRIAATVAYRANCFVGFVNAVDCVHGITPRPATPAVRRYVDFVCELPFRLLDPPQMGFARRMLYRALHRPRSRAYNPEE